MDWTLFEENIYYKDGSLRDIYIHGTTIEDWEKWVNFVNGRYQLEWYNGLKDQKYNQIDFNVVLEYFKDYPDFSTSAIITIDNLNIHTYFLTSQEIENDINPKEFTSSEDHKKLMDYLTDVSKLLNKKVILTPVNTPEIILIEVTENKISYPGLKGIA